MFLLFNYVASHHLKGQPFPFCNITLKIDMKRLRHPAEISKNHHVPGQWQILHLSFKGHVFIRT